MTFIMAKPEHIMIKRFIISMKSSKRLGRCNVADRAELCPSEPADDSEREPDQNLKVSVEVMTNSDTL